MGNSVVALTRENEYGVACISFTHADSLILFLLFFSTLSIAKPVRHFSFVLDHLTLIAKNKSVQMFQK